MTRRMRHHAHRACKWGAWLSGAGSAGVAAATAGGALRGFDARLVLVVAVGVFVATLAGVVLIKDHG